MKAIFLSKYVRVLSHLKDVKKDREENKSGAIKMRSELMCKNEN